MSCFLAAERVWESRSNSSLSGLDQMQTSPCSISPGRKEGYILHNALSSCVGRLRVLEKLQDLLQALLVWLPVHGARRTAGVGAWVSAGSLGFCVRPKLSPRGRGGCMQTQALSADKQRPPIRACPSAESPPTKPSSATQSGAWECEWGEYKSGPSGPGTIDPHRAYRGTLFLRRSTPPPPRVTGLKASASLEGESEGPAPAVFQVKAQSTRIPCPQIQPSSSARSQQPPRLLSSSSPDPSHPGCLP